MPEKMNKDVIEKVNSFFRAPVTANEIGKKLIENKTIDFLDEKSRNSYFLSILKSCENEIYSFSYAGSDGEYYGALRNKKGEMELIKNNDETGKENWRYSANEDYTVGQLIVNAGLSDPRLLEWYQTAVKEKGLVFSPVYRDFLVDELAVSVSSPLYDEEGRLKGVLGAHMSLSDIGNYLNKQTADSRGTVSVVEEDTSLLIANSMGEVNYTVNSDGSLVRNTIDALSFPVIKESYKKYLKSHEAEIPLKTGKDNWLTNVEVYRMPGLNWVIISAVPENFLPEELNRNIRISLELEVAAGILSIGTFFLIARKLYKPNNGLVTVEEGIFAGNLEHIVEMRTQELNKANEILKENQSRLHLILDTTAEAIFSTDLNGSCTFCNKSCLALLGYSRLEELIGVDMRTMFGCTGQEDWSGVLKRADGSCFEAEYRTRLQQRDGQHVGYVITVSDITERKRGEERTRFLSDHDPLTGLVNRRCFEQELKQVDTHQNLPISMIFLDLNGLKLMNDAFGHKAGDEFIVKVAGVLKRCCRAGDVAARIGGDEFTILLPHTSKEEAEAIACGIKNQVAAEKVNMVSCSIALGTATKSRHWQKIEWIQETAENEMYKEKGVSSIKFGIHAINGIITSLHMKSPWEKIHSEEVSKLCEKIGIAMGLPETELKKLRDGAYLHDIGKITLSESILEKTPDQLTEAEHELIRQHPAIGYRILNLSQETLDLANGVYGHHECWDGSGYPKGLKGEEIPLFSRILSVAEGYERNYNREKDPETGTVKALQAITRGSGKKYDPEIARLFVRIMKEEKESSI